MSRLSTHADAARWVEGDLTDTLQLIRDRGGVTDDVVNPTTFRLERPAGDFVSLYIGPGLLRGVNREGRADEGGRVAYRPHWRVRLPLGALEPATNDVVVLLASKHNPGLVGTRVKLKGPLGGSLSVSRIWTAEDETAATVR